MKLESPHAPKLLSAYDAHKGTPPAKKNFFRALPEKGGGPARIVWPFFYHVLVPKIGKDLPRTLYICMIK